MGFDNQYDNQPKKQNNPKLSECSMQKPIRTIEDAKLCLSSVNNTPSIKNWINDVIDICHIFYKRDLDAAGIEKIKEFLQVSATVTEMRKNPNNFSASEIESLSYIKRPLDKETFIKLNDIIDEYSKDKFYMPEEAMKNISKVIKGERRVDEGGSHISEALEVILKQHGLWESFLKNYPEQVEIAKKYREIVKKNKRNYDRKYL